jgi:hypothetical protein
VTPAFWLSQAFGGLALVLDVVKFTRTKRSAITILGKHTGYVPHGTIYFYPDVTVYGGQYRSI